jgi:hypothetical protein
MMTLAHYITHAERYGAEGVFEAAADDELDAGDLAVLERRLRELDRKWRPPPCGNDAATLHVAARGLTRDSDQGSTSPTRKVGHCRACGEPLEGYRAHATVCRKPACRKRAQRAAA